MKQVEKLSAGTCREVTRSVWVDTGSPAPCRAGTHRCPGTRCLCPPAVIATDSKILLHSSLERSIAQIQAQHAEDREKASKCLSLWAKSRFHRGPTDLSVWKESHILFCKHKDFYITCLCKKLCKLLSNKVSFCSLIHITNKKKANKI